MKKKQKQKNVLLFSEIALVAFVLALILTMVGLSQTVSEFSETAISKTPDAILASAGVVNNSEVALPVLYFDQRADECVNMYDVEAKSALYQRQFEWGRCGYDNKQIEQGIVSYMLSEDYLPVAEGGEMLSNRGLTDMSRWFDEVEGKSKSYNGVLKMNYRSNGAEFVFYKEEFYPLDEAEFSRGDYVNTDGHNHLFTMNFAVPFMALLSGEEGFEIVADDDTFVYVGDKLAIDMGGIHDAAMGRLLIHKDGEVYAGVGNEELAFTGITVEGKESSIVRIFHADRDASDSTLRMVFRGMKLAVESTKIAGTDNMGIQVAYDPTDPSYVAPLGESVVVKPDETKSYIVLATIEATFVVVFAVVLVYISRTLLKSKIRK